MKTPRMIRVFALTILFAAITEARQENRVAFGLKPSDVSSVVAVDACDRPGPGGCSCSVQNYWLTGGSTENCGALWRDLSRFRYYQARTTSGYIDVYDSTTFGPNPIPGESFPLAAGPASSIAIREDWTGTTNLVAAVNTTAPITGTIEVRTTANPPGGLVYSQTCQNVRFDAVSANCDGQIGALVTSFGSPGPPAGKYFTTIPVSSCSGGSSWVLLSVDPEVNNEYLTPDARRNWWIPTSLGSNRSMGTLFKIPYGGPMVAFPGLGGRRVMPDWPDPDTCTNLAKPYVFVLQQDWTSDTNPVGRVLRINQNGTVLGQVDYNLLSGIAPWFNKKVDMLGMLNVEADVPPDTGGPGYGGGSVWIAYRDLNPAPFSSRPGTITFLET